jgi:uncharacterized BrkB/YihY/UPF0761 family membrane protein
MFMAMAIIADVAAVVMATAAGVRRGRGDGKFVHLVVVSLAADLKSFSGVMVMIPLVMLCHLCLGLLLAAAAGFGGVGAADVEDAAADAAGLFEVGAVTIESAAKVGVASGVGGVVTLLVMGMLVALGLC